MTARPFQLQVDSGSVYEPRTRYFGTLEAALVGMRQLDERWLPFVSVREFSSEVPVVHVRDGAAVSNAARDLGVNA